MGDLESRLANYDTRIIKDKVIAKLASRRYEDAASKSNPYYKYNLVPSIVELINEYAPTRDGFASNLDYHLNKYEAKRVYYGLVCMGEPTEELKQIVGKLEDWEKVCFFAGVWNDREMVGIRAKNLKEIIKDYIKKGYDSLHKIHMIRKAEGIYKRELKLPGSQDYARSKS